MAFFYRARVWVLVAAGLIFFLSGTARIGASDNKINGRHFADLEARARQGYAQQQFELGHAYFYGFGVPQDFQDGAAM
jgi:TPR repeat protein